MPKNNQKGKKSAFKWILLAVLGLILALVLVGEVFPDQEYIPKNIVDAPSKAVSMVMEPIQNAFSVLTGFAKDYLAEWKLRTTISTEYNRLRAQNDELTYQAMLNGELEAENERLKDLLGVVDDYRLMNPVVAKVTNKETGNWFRTFTINKGRVDGIETEMAVVNADGLIGYIYEVYETSSEVISIVDSRCSVAAIIQSSRDQGIIKGTLGIEEEASCRMYYLPVDLVPRPGDTVVTSGVGQPFPKGLPIGVVRESTRYMDENKHYVVVEPYVDFMHIEEVLVLVYRAEKEEMPDADDGQLDYVPAVQDTARPDPVIGDKVENPDLGAVTPPPRTRRNGAEATPTPNPELDALMREELAEDMEEEEEQNNTRGYLLITPMPNDTAEPIQFEQIPGEE